MATLLLLRVAAMRATVLRAAPTPSCVAVRVARMLATATVPRTASTPTKGAGAEGSTPGTRSAAQNPSSASLLRRIAGSGLRPGAAATGNAGSNAAPPLSSSLFRVGTRTQQGGKPAAGGNNSNSPFMGFESWVAHTQNPHCPLTLKIVFRGNKMRVSLIGPTGVLVTVTPRLLKLPNTVRDTSECGSVVIREASRKIAELDLSKLSNPEAHKSIDLHSLYRKGVHVQLSGFGKHRRSAVDALGTLCLPIVRLSDITKIKYGGCRPPKRRRK